MLSVRHKGLHRPTGVGQYLIDPLLRGDTSNAAALILRIGYDVRQALHPQNMLDIFHVIRKAKASLQHIRPGHIIAFYEDDISIRAEVLLIEMVVKLIEGRIL